MNFHGGYFGKEALVDFSVNIPPIPYDEAYKQFLISHIDKLQKYPELSGSDTITAIAETLGYDSSQIILGNGATELIYLFARTNHVRRVLILEPTFTEYQRAFETYNIEIRHFLLDIDNPEKLDVAGIIKYIKEEAIDMLAICNPNNPTGHLYRVSELKAILEGVNTSDFKLFIDESFIDFVPKEYQQTYHDDMRTLLDEHSVFLLRSMTKTFSVPGLRIGYGIGSPSLIEQMYKYKEPWSLNTFALASIPFFLKKQDLIDAVNLWSQTENEKMALTLSSLDGLTLIKGKANFHLIRVEKMSGKLFFEKMIAKGIYLRTCLDFYGLDEQYFRIALRNNEDNAWFIEQLSDVLEERK